MNDDLTFLASAYLDGNITPAERVQVEGDIDLLAEVERLRQVRAVLGSTETTDFSPRAPPGRCA
jgi:CII-binding regulator of phage lambda lysogenization HflD